MSGKVEAKGKWNGDNLFWEMTDGEMAFCLTDSTLRHIYHSLDLPLRYVGPVVRKMHVDACWNTLIARKRP